MSKSIATAGSGTIGDTGREPYGYVQAINAPQAKGQMPSNITVKRPTGSIVTISLVEVKNFNSQKCRSADKERYTKWLESGVAVYQSGAYYSLES